MSGASAVTDPAADAYRIRSLDLTYHACSRLGAALSGLARYRDRVDDREPTVTIDRPATGETMHVHVQEETARYERPDWLPGAVTEAAGGTYPRRTLRITGDAPVLDGAAAADRTDVDHEPRTYAAPTAVHAGSRRDPVARIAPEGETERGASAHVPPRSSERSEFHRDRP